MEGVTSTGVYDELGVKPVINARGHLTVLGGSSPSPRVLAAMEAANRYYVDMAELLEKSGRVIAELLGAEAAYVTPGAGAALALGMAACIAGSDREKMARLPDTTGMRRELLIQKRQRYAYDRCPTIVGARLVEVGDDGGTSAGQLAAAIGPAAAAILYPAHLEGREGTVALAEVLSIAHARGVPVLVDAAGQVYPVERMKGYPASGADLVCYGAKYIGAPHSTGILCGRRELVESAAAQGFIAFETGGHIAFGRPLKLDRQEIIAVVAALREWLEMDHGARLRAYDRKAQTITRAALGLPGVTATALPEPPAPATRLRIAVDPARAGRTASEVARALLDGYPGVAVGVDGDALSVSVATLLDGDEEVVAARLREVLARQP